MRSRIRPILGVERPSGSVTITAANLLTILRILIVPVFIITFISGWFPAKIISTFLFIAGACTDYFDGRIARLRGETTPFGNFMDPLADKLLVLFAFWLILVNEPFFDYFLATLIGVILISVREIGLTAIRFSSIRGGNSLVTSFWGKLKTTVQLTALIASLLLLNIRDYLSEKDVNIGWFVDGRMILIISILFLLSALTSVMSGILYVRGLSFNPQKSQNDF